MGRRRKLYQENIYKTDVALLILEKIDFKALFKMKIIRRYNSYLHAAS